MLFRSCHKEDAPLLGLMGQSMRLIGKRAQELYAEYDLNRAQSGILFALHQEDSMSQKELAKRLNVTPPSITSMIKKMEQEGYITRKADEQDQRVMRLTLAQKGKDCIDYVITYLIGHMQCCRTTISFRKQSRRRPRSWPWRKRMPWRPSR